MSRIVVDEEMLRIAAITCGPESTFYTILAQGIQYKKAGLTPVYVFDNVLGMVEVMTEENHTKMLN